jgi:hypothetical protein
VGKKRSKKQKTQRRIAKWISDGKISGKEAKKAQKQGISLKRIQKAQTRSYTKPKSYFYQAAQPKKSPLQIAAAKTRRKMDSGPGRQTSAPLPREALYRPLIIKKEADQVFNTPQQQQPVAQVPQDPVPQDPDPGVIDPGAIDPVEEVVDDYDPFQDFMMNMLPGILESMKPPQYEPLPPPPTYASIGQAAQSAPGVKARRSSASISQQSSLGSTGAFNRGGLRISNLNI